MAGDIPVILKPPGVPYTAEDTPSESDMGKDDPNTIFYVHLTASNIPAKCSDRLEKLGQLLDLTHKWLDTHAGIQTKNRKADGSLPASGSEASAWRRQDYRIKVVDVIMIDDCAWISDPNSEQYSRDISVEKGKFHLALLAEMLAGVAPITEVPSKLENALQGLAANIVGKQGTADHRAVWALFLVSTWDADNERTKDTVRVIRARITPLMKKVVIGKGDLETMEVQFQYTASGLIFSEKTWDMVRSEIERFLEEIPAPQVRSSIVESFLVEG